MTVGSIAPLGRTSKRNASGVAALVLGLWLAGSLSAPTLAQVDEDQPGAWYMYFWNTRLKDSQWGFQGDGQWRAWDLLTDMEQLLLRGGVTYTTKKGDATFTLGYANVTSGEFGDGHDTFGENRIYQEALLPQKIGKRVYLRHRFRYEQRWVEDQNFRTRFRYAIFLDVPFRGTAIRKGALYAALYNELFINGERDIGYGQEVELFDRNRLYGGIGYALTGRRKLQFGYMIQTQETFSKAQLQLSFHHTFGPKPER
jgi:hypothetical protein